MTLIEFILAPLLELGGTVESLEGFLTSSSAWLSDLSDLSVCVVGREKWGGRRGILPVLKLLDAYIIVRRTTALYEVKSVKHG